jgi:hypothetical protein
MLRSIKLRRPGLLGTTAADESGAYYPVKPDEMQSHRQGSPWYALRISIHDETADLVAADRICCVASKGLEARQSTIPLCDGTMMFSTIASRGSGP